MGELTASLAHEIKQPITAAVTNAKTCLRWLGRDQPDLLEARDAASRIVSDVTRAADIISRISLLFKKGALQHELVDVNGLIEEMILLLRNEAGRYAISIRSELAEDLYPVMADRIQLQQVFMNLMLNGIDAMKDVSSARELTIRSQQVKDGQLLISVGDTGIGLPPQQAEQIFSAFFTTKASRNRYGAPHQPLDYRDSWRTFVGDLRPWTGRKFSFHSALRSRKPSQLSAVTAGRWPGSCFIPQHQIAKVRSGVWWSSAIQRLWASRLWDHFEHLIAAF